MKPAEFRRKMSEIAHPQGAQRHEVKFGKPLVPDSNLPDTLPASAPAAPPTTYPNYLAPQNQNVSERQKTEKRDYSIVAMGGVGAVGARYILTVVVDNDVDALATVSQTPSGIKFDSGAVVVLTANPSAGYHFEEWTIAWGTLSSLDNPISVTMDSNKIIIARFTPD